MAAEVAMRVPLQPWAEQADAVVKAYESDAVKGLLPAEAERRLQRYGPNRLREATRRSGLVIFLRQFADWMIGLLALAASISAAIGEWQDSLLIAAIVFGNGHADRI